MQQQYTSNTSVAYSSNITFSVTIYVMIVTQKSGGRVFNEEKSPNILYLEDQDWNIEPVSLHIFTSVKWFIIINLSADNLVSSGWFLNIRKVEINTKRFRHILLEIRTSVFEGQHREVNSSYHVNIYSIFLWAESNVVYDLFQLSFLFF